MSEKFGQEIAKLWSEISKLKSSHSLSVQTADEIRLEAENRYLRQKVLDLEERLEAVKQEARVVHDKNKSLSTAFRLQNSEIEKLNSHTTQEGKLHPDEASWDSDQKDTEWNQAGSKRRKQQKKNQNTPNSANTEISGQTESRNENSAPKKELVIILGDIQHSR